jgi:catechol 2,3-dioxygenase-like lactoylglutathione lyase family enzyme
VFASAGIKLWVRATLKSVLTGIAHVGVCVPDVEAATRWYSEVLGLTVHSPPYRMSGEAIERDMSELVPSPVVLKASIVGFGDSDSDSDSDSDHVLELIEYPEAPDEAASPDAGSLTRQGLTHVGFLCDDIESTRVELEARGVDFLTAGIADVAGLRTTWCTDPWGTIIILLEKKSGSRPYWRQFGA